MLNISPSTIYTNEFKIWELDSLFERPLYFSNLISRNPFYKTTFYKASLCMLPHSSTYSRRGTGPSFCSSMGF
jgi:hypothetical protein